MGSCSVRSCNSARFGQTKSVHGCNLLNVGDGLNGGLNVPTDQCGMLDCVIRTAATHKVETGGGSGEEEEERRVGRKRKRGGSDGGGVKRGSEWN